MASPVKELAQALVEKKLGDSAGRVCWYLVESVDQKLFTAEELGLHGSRLEILRTFQRFDIGRYNAHRQAFLLDISTRGTLIELRKELKKSPKKKRSAKKKKEVIAAEAHVSETNQKAQEYNAEVDQYQEHNRRMNRVHNAPSDQEVFEKAFKEPPPEPQTVFPDDAEVAKWKAWWDAKHAPAAPRIIEDPELSQQLKAEVPVIDDDKEHEKVLQQEWRNTEPEQRARVKRKKGKARVAAKRVQDPKPKPAKGVPAPARKKNRFPTKADRSSEIEQARCVLPVPRDFYRESIPMFMEAEIEHTLRAEGYTPGDIDKYRRDSRSKLYPPGWEDTRFWWQREHIANVDSPTVHRFMTTGSLDQPHRRSFSDEYKQDIVEAYHDEFLTMQELAEFEGISANAVRNWIAKDREEEEELTLLPFRDLEPAPKEPDPIPCQLAGKWPSEAQERKNRLRRQFRKMVGSRRR